MRPGDLKLIRTSELVRFELYDLEKDPGERLNVAAEHPKVYEEMKAEMVSIYTEIQGQGRDWRESWLRRW